MEKAENDDVNEGQDETANEAAAEDVEKGVGEESQDIENADEKPKDEQNDNPDASEAKPEESTDETPAAESAENAGETAAAE